MNNNTYIYHFQDTNPIPNYIIKKLIDEQSGTRIYEGQNIQTQQFVAIKKLPQNQEKYACREVDISNYIKDHKLQSEHIVQIYEILHIEQDTYLIMELCESDLEQYIKKYNNKQQQQSEVDMIYKAIDILGQIIKGYQCLSQQFGKKFMHRDIKPKNILYKDGIFKLCDFELARFHDIQIDLTKNIGTKYFIAPELLTNQKTNYDNKCDVYSLGVVLYWMIYQDYELDLNKIQQPGLYRLIRDMIAQDPNYRMSFQDLIKDSFFTQEPRMNLHCQYMMYDHRKLSQIVPVANSNLETYFESYEVDILNINRLFTSILKMYQNNFHLRVIYAIWIKVIDQIYISKNSQELVKLKGDLQIQQILQIKQSQDQNINVEFLSLEELTYYFQQISSKLPDTQLKKQFLQFLQQKWSEDNQIQYPKHVES